MRDEAEHQQNLEATLQQINALLDRQARVHRLVEREQTRKHDLVQALVARQQEAELAMRLNRLHPADAAFVLESLPPENRETAWQLIQAERRGAILLELAPSVRESLLAGLNRNEIVNVAAQLDSVGLAGLVHDLPQDVAGDLLARLDPEGRAQVQSALNFPEGSVGALAEFNAVTVREDVTLEAVIRFLRLRKELPLHTNDLFVVDREGVLQGLLPLKLLVLKEGSTLVEQVMTREPVYFFTDDPARDAAAAFERYDLITAPVVNLHKHVVGRLTVDAVLDHVQQDAFKQSLSQVGLSEDENLFAPVRESARNRWPWLALNLFTAFIASRVIGVFENSIAQLAALAALMPIVASIGGNTGNQTVALVIRGIALKQIQPENLRFILRKECTVALFNGALWGGVMGVAVLMLYQKLTLALVMAAAMLLNMEVAALVGVLCPLLLHRFGRDPVMGSSILLTASTDSLGFFIFLGLASVFLL